MSSPYQPPHQKTKELIGAVIRKQEIRHKVPRSVLRAVLGRMRFTLHATRCTHRGASRLVRAMSAWLVKTRRAPSRHSRDATVHGHTTRAMHKLSTPPPLSLISGAPCCNDHFPSSIFPSETPKELPRKNVQRYRCHDGASAWYSSSLELSRIGSGVFQNSRVGSGPTRHRPDPREGIRVKSPRTW